MVAPAGRPGYESRIGCWCDGVRRTLRGPDIGSEGIRRIRLILDYSCDKGSDMAMACGWWKESEVGSTAGEAEERVGHGYACVALLSLWRKLQIQFALPPNLTVGYRAMSDSHLSTWYIGDASIQIIICKGRICRSSLRIRGPFSSGGERTSPPLRNSE
jgi:hypothetical protein